mgnify:CR=1 FL=1
MPVEMKNIIAETFATLVKQKGIDKVTVKSLIDACHISRQTFYYHFQDIMDVVEWSTQKALQDILSRSLEKDTPQEALDVLISSILENKVLLRKLLDSQRRGEMEHLFMMTARSFFEETLKARGPTLSVSYADLDIALDFFAFGITGTILRNLAQERTDTRKLAEQICRILPNYIVE